MTSEKVNDVPRAAIEAMHEMREHAKARETAIPAAADVERIMLGYGRDLLELLRESGLDHANIGVSNSFGIPSISVFGMSGVRTAFSDIYVGGDVDNA